ncbi:hypothetical protein BGZ72_002273 [Mortierella alpina]|nr:hypothetical protein BGZ72_002273 [Mortierella alpina]
MIMTAVAVAIFVRRKDKMSNSGKRKTQIMALCLSSFMAALLLFYAGRLINLAQTESLTLYYLAGCDVAIAILLIIDGVLSELDSIHQNNKFETSSRNSSSSREDHASGALQEPLPVHIYQPRLSLTSNQRTAINSGTRVPTNEDMEATPHDDDFVELEELPKYERRRPVQQATIVDMANLESVDTTVLGLDISVPSVNGASNDGNALEQGRESRLQLGDISTAEAPEYSPSLVEAPAAAPVPNYDLSTQLASCTNSGSSVVLTMPVSDAPAGPPPTAAHIVAPTVTVTSAPPVYSP